MIEGVTGGRPLPTRSADRDVADEDTHRPGNRSAPPSAPRAPSEGGDLRQKVALAVIPALIAAGATLAGTLYVQSGKVSVDQRAALTKLKDQVLDDTSAVANALRKTRSRLVNQGYKASLPWKAKYAAARDRWYDEQVKLRERVGELYDAPTAALLTDRGSINYLVDRCGVFVARDDPARGNHCAERLRREVVALTTRQDAINAGRDIPSSVANVVIPLDFTTSLSAANSLLERMADCKRLAIASQARGSTIALPVDCSNPTELQHALNLRVNLVGLSQQAIEDAMSKRR